MSVYYIAVDNSYAIAHAGKKKGVWSNSGSKGSDGKANNSSEYNHQYYEKHKSKWLDNAKKTYDSNLRERKRKTNQNRQARATEDHRRDAKVDRSFEKDGVRFGQWTNKRRYMTSTNEVKKTAYDNGKRELSYRASRDRKEAAHDKIQKVKDAAGAAKDTAKQLASTKKKRSKTTKESRAAKLKSKASSLTSEEIDRGKNIAAKIRSGKKTATGHGGAGNVSTKGKMKPASNRVSVNKTAARKSATSASEDRSEDRAINAAKRRQTQRPATTATTTRRSTGSSAARNYSKTLAQRNAAAAEANARKGTANAKKAREDEAVRQYRLKNSSSIQKEQNERAAEANARKGTAEAKKARDDAAYKQALLRVNEGQKMRDKTKADQKRYSDQQLAQARLRVSEGQKMREKTKRDQQAYKDRQLQEAINRYNAANPSKNGTEVTSSNNSIKKRTDAAKRDQKIDQMYDANSDYYKKKYGKNWKKALENDKAIYKAMTK